MELDLPPHRRPREFSVAGFQPNAAQPLASMPSQAAQPAAQKGGRTQMDEDEDDDEVDVNRVYTLGREAVPAGLRFISSTMGLIHSTSESRISAGHG